jgi:hypothetical protein
MNFEKSNIVSPPPYNYATVQPTNSWINPFSPNDTIRLSSDENIIQPILINNNAKTTSTSSTYLECLRCCTDTLEILVCCCMIFECLK